MTLVIVLGVVVCAVTVADSERMAVTTFCDGNAIAATLKTDPPLLQAVEPGAIALRVLPEPMANPVKTPGA